MVTIEEMRNAEKHNVRVVLNSSVDNRIVEGYCTEYLWPEDEDEKHNITLLINQTYYEINIDEIESIEILD